MKPPGSGACPPSTRSRSSAVVSGQRTDAAITSRPQTAAAACSGSVRGQRSATSPPTTTYARNAPCTSATPSASSRQPTAQPQPQAPPQQPPAGGAAPGPEPVSATVDSNRTASGWPAGQVAGSADSAIGRDSSKVAVRGSVHSWQRNS